MRRTLIASVASMALAASAAAAAPDNRGKGHGSEQGNAKASPGDKGGDKGGGGKQAASENQPDKAPTAKEDKQASRPAMQSPIRGQDEQRGKKNEARQSPARVAEDKPRRERPGDKAQDRDKGKVTASPQRPERKDLKRVTYKGAGGREVIVPTNDRVRVLTERRDFDWALLDRRNVYKGCPPGLAKKYNGCMPPGLDREPRFGWFQPDWYLHGYDRTYRYRYLDGYMLRLGTGDSVLSFIPLLGGALAIGQVWPSAYEPVALPPYYDSYYDLGPANSYRYYDDTIYRVDPDTAAIESVAALLTGNDIVIGEPMPAGYDIYNVPYGYRDQYYDGPDAYYRYSDGYIYQVDPTTRLVQAAIELLV